MLIRIALCEDNSHDQQEAKRHLELWAAQSKHEIFINIYADSNKLIGAVDTNFEVFDVYILDIEMTTKLEGLELARTIRKKHKDVPIIFITSHTELALDSYDVYALHFIGKPIDKKRFFGTLERLANILEGRAEKYLTCTIEGRLMRVPLYEILYLSTDGHYLLINGDGMRRFRGKIRDVVKEHPDSFVVCHQSYVVNIDHTRSLISSNLVLSNGESIPVSKANLPAVRQRFAKFYSLST